MRRSLVAVAVLVLVVSVDAQEQLKNLQILTGMSRPEVWEVMNQMETGRDLFHLPHRYVAPGADAAIAASGAA